MHKLQQSAMTLLELLMVVLLITLISFHAVPALSHWVEAHRHRLLQEKLHYQLQAARSQAVMRGLTLEICASADGRQCSGSWSEGWILKTANTDDVFMSERLPESSSSLHWHGYSHHIQFRRDGQAPRSNGRFYLCHDGQVLWQLVLNRQGRVRQTSLSENQAEAHRCM